MYKQGLCCSLIALGLLLSSWATAKTIRVPADYTSVQDAINMAATGDVVMVSPGIYKVHELSFDGKAITVRSTDPTSPTIVETTILDADYKGAAVIYSNAETAASLLSGFSIIHGTASEGGAIRVNEGCQPTISNNLLRNNSASRWGGAIFIRGNATLRDNIIRNNTCSESGGGIYTYCAGPKLIGNTIQDNTASRTGGGLYLLGSPAVFEGNIIKSNRSNYSGGGLFLDQCDTTFRNNTLLGNISYGPGGGLFIGRGKPTLSNTLIAGNKGEQGGGLFISACSPVLTNNTITGNAINSVLSTKYGGGIYCDGTSTPTLTNCIVAANGKGCGLYRTANATLPITYCNFYNNTGGSFNGVTNPIGSNGNITVDPLFTNPAQNDYRLKSMTGRWNGSSWVADTVSSPCIDAGDPASAYGTEPQPNGGRINLGFDGNTTYASKSLATTTPPLVKAWTPKGTSVVATANITVTFTLPMNRTSVRNALTINGVKAAKFGGAFSWAGSKLTFNPTQNLKPGMAYKIVIGTSAKSSAGVALPKAHSWLFAIRGTARPFLTAAAASTAQGAQIAVNLAAAAKVSVSVRNLAGREVAALSPGLLEAGVRTVLWNGRSQTGTKVPAGTYLVAVMANGTDGASAKAVAALQLR